ncbi:MAG: hypothetical protein WAK18_04830 [Nocardioidaceae bacterium]
MHVRMRAATIFGLGAALLLPAGPLSSADAITTQQQTGSAATKATGHIPTVVAHMSKAAIHLSVGHRVHAGRTIFTVKTRKGTHTLQLLRLHKGYTMQQAGADINKAFGGDLAAIRRVDHRITFLGGASARPGRPGEFAVNLRAAKLVLLDQNSNAATNLKVFGKTPSRPQIPVSSGITTFSYGFGSSMPPLPRSGWTRVSNRSDQPHFVIFQRVADNTTNRMVRRFVKSGPHGNPPWVLKVNTNVGVISPKVSVVFHYSLPAGKYLLACFWPDDDSGMPHFNMGMWKLITLK